MTENFDIRDQLVFEHAPAVMVPSHSPLRPLPAPGHRYLVARDGVYLDVKRAALDVRTRIALTIPPLPYGSVGEHIVPAFGRLSQHLPLLHRFLADARNNLPNEFAAWLVWDEFECALRYRACKTITASPGTVHFECPRLDRNESLAVDLHSHGTGAAFFSLTDDIDDAGAVKISGVIGNIDRDTPSAKFRVCALGTFIEVPVAEGTWK